VGEDAYVSRVVPSRFDRNTVYATFDRHKMGDFTPYVLMSRDLGRTWTNVAGDLPKNGSVYAFVQDSKNADLWFVGTEFGVYCTPDAGKRWIELKGGMPRQCVRDLAIQRRDDALVVCSFSRGFYILDESRDAACADRRAHALARGQPAAGPRCAAVHPGEPDGQLG
jgi:photosystem II stability/assembly factor-like uncharacterized protein